MRMFKKFIPNIVLTIILIGLIIGVCVLYQALPEAWEQGSKATLLLGGIIFLSLIAFGCFMADIVTFYMNFWED